MIVDRFWVLLSKKIFFEASEAELKEFDQLILDHPNLKESAETLTLLSNQPIPVENDEEAELAFEKHSVRMESGLNENQASELVATSDIAIDTDARHSTRSRLKKWLFSLSVLLVGLSLFLIFRNNIVSANHSVGGKVHLSQVSTKPGSKTQIQLPDGSSVWLNASSNLTYDKDFGKNFREVSLTGEAFFDVVKDAAHPFIIHTKVIDVKVLGTEFNVRAYPNDAYTETSLIRGSVEGRVKDRPNEIHFLKPYEKVSVANNILNDDEIVRKVKTKPFILMQPLTYAKTDSTVIETSWVQNKLIFQENETFKEVAVKMERWYGVQIGFADEGVAQIRPFGSFTTETISQALDALKESFKFNYKTNGNHITITR